MRGMSLGLFASTRDENEQRRIYRTLLDEMRTLGVTDVQIVVEWMQQDIRAVEIAPDPMTPSDTLLRDVVAAAKERGLRVFLMPILRIEQRAGRDWRGTLAPVDRDRWWVSYRRFILHYAELAARSDVDLFSVGSELISMELDAQVWRELIADVRTRFRGALTYSANWDHFEPIAFWDELDVMGVTAYQPLGAPGERDDMRLAAGFLTFKAKLGAFARQRRYVFTEVGYPSSSHAAVRPWDHRSSAVDLELQVACYRALFRAWHDDTKLAGIFVWNWFGFGGDDDPSHTPRNKPAAAVLEHWYRARREAW
jgi:hypothetical protein